MFITRTILLLICFFPLSNLLAMDAQCDLIGPNLNSVKKTTKARCWQNCEDLQECQGAVFISSWNRCFLKSTVKRKASVKMFSAIKGGEGSYDRDYSAKDMKRLVFAKVDQCREACAKEETCSGFTYIDGYRDCWLKRGKGKVFEKVFFCKVK